jgi:hypothetical protein
MLGTERGVTRYDTIYAQQGKEFSLSIIVVQTALGWTRPPIQWVLAALSPGVKQQGREADHSPLASAKIKKMWIYTSTPPHAYMPQSLIG